MRGCKHQTEQVSNCTDIPSERTNQCKEDTEDENHLLSVATKVAEPSTKFCYLLSQVDNEGDQRLNGISHCVLQDSANLLDLLGTRLENLVKLKLLLPKDSLSVRSRLE